MADYNIANVLDNQGDLLPDTIGLAAVKKGAWHSWSFKELADTANFFTTSLHEKGVKKGDRVMLMVRPSKDFICLTFALFQLGAVVILIDPGMGYKNLLRCISSVKPEILVGIPQAILFSRIFRKPFATLRHRISVGNSWLAKGTSRLDIVPKEKTNGSKQLLNFQAGQNDLAAIIFTTGSTGPPKGVQYTHGIFHAQLELIRDYFGISKGDIDQPGFPLFGLFSIALGASAVIPDMDPTRPAKVDPKKFVASIKRFGVTYSFGSPAIWNVVSRYCLENNITLPVKKILMAGAPVSGELISRVQKIIADDGQIFTPYGATESLPIVAIEGREVIDETWSQTQIGKGTCVGRSLPGITIKVIVADEGAITAYANVREVAIGEIGEIIVKGPVVTNAYDGNDKENRVSKIPDGEFFWHRMGDMGYLDNQSRLWFCGRKAHRVFTEKGTLYTIPCEAIFNEHPLVFRSALVGVGKKGQQRPVIIIESLNKIRREKKLFSDLKLLAKANDLTRDIDTFLIHPKFPVDIRHNAKIFREKLALWAARKLGVTCD